MCFLAFQLLQETIHRVDVIIRTLCISGFLVVSGPRREVCGQRMIGAGQRAIRNSVAVTVAIALEDAGFFSSFFRRS